MIVNTSAQANENLKSAIANSVISVPVFNTVFIQKAH